MKRKNREINIFSMSALDLFASAMGAFLLIAVMALPYYLKVNPDLIKDLEKVKHELIVSQKDKKDLEKKLLECQQNSTNSQKKIDKIKKDLILCQKKSKELEKKYKQAQKRIQQLEGKVSSLNRELSKTFCVIKLSWESPKKEDVDLHVVDPAGHEFYFAKRTFPNTHGSLTVDSVGVMKGAEVWIDKELIKGTYIIKYVYYGGSGSVKVHGMVLTKSFTKDLPVKTLVNPNKTKKIVVAKIIVDENGNASLETY